MSCFFWLGEAIKHDRAVATGYGVAYETVSSNTSPHQPCGYLTSEYRNSGNANGLRGRSY
jgi:hypothetical protein